VAAQSPPAKKNLQEPGADFKMSVRKALTASPVKITIPALSKAVISLCSLVGAADAGARMSSHDVDVSSPASKLVAACKRNPRIELVEVEGILLKLLAMPVG